MSHKTGQALHAAMDNELATIQTDRLSIHSVSARRSKAPTFSGGLAAHTSSRMYQGAGHGKPKAKRWDHRLTEESKARKPNSLKGLAQYVSRPGMISLGGGLPSSHYFPIEHIETKVPSGMLALCGSILIPETDSSIVSIRELRYSPFSQSPMHLYSLVINASTFQRPCILIMFLFSTPFF